LFLLDSLNRKSPDADKERRRVDIIVIRAKADFSANPRLLEAQQLRRPMPRWSAAVGAANHPGTSW
jgi:hypothetical protein